MSSFTDPSKKPEAAQTSEVLLPAQPAGQFTRGTLSLSDLDPSPINQFHTWFKEAIAYPIPQSEACTLATCALPSGSVSARIVYLKSLDDRGFVIYSNWGTSRKSADVKSNPNVALTFWWKELQRQVRVEGKMHERLPKEEEQKYFDSRVRESKVGAWASRQSEILNDREALEEQVKEIEGKFEGKEAIPVPDFWGGMRVVPETIEFWQGRQGRLHDRLKYIEDGKGAWKIERLSP
jgi:pyridoxamine 5'-phosphate oxidase